MEGNDKLCKASQDKVKKTKPRSKEHLRLTQLDKVISANSFPFGFGFRARQRARGGKGEGKGTGKGKGKGRV